MYFVTHQEYGIEEEDAALEHLCRTAAPVLPLRTGTGVGAEEAQLVSRHFSLTVILSLRHQFVAVNDATAAALPLSLRAVLARIINSHTLTTRSINQQRTATPNLATH